MCIEFWFRKWACGAGNYLQLWYSVLFLLASKKVSPLHFRGCQVNVLVTFTKLSSSWAASALISISMFQEVMGKRNYYIGKASQV
jgi:hypothetical protein